MIIAIDGYEANVDRPVGISRFAFEIINGIHKIVANNPDKQKNLTFRIYLPSGPNDNWPKPTSWWQYFIRKPTKFWTFVGLPLALKKDRPQADVVFSPTHYIPRFTKIPKVMAIMDLSYFYFPQMFKSKDLHQLTNWTKYSVQKASKIITISKYSRNDIIKRYGIPSKRVIVAYPGLINMDNGKLNDQNVLKNYGISEPYILSVGTIQPRKNYANLIEAFAKARGEINKIEKSEVSLLIIGKKGWLYEDILAAPARFGVLDQVKFLESVSDEDLSYFYRKALCLALPSLYEGFGLPVLESMSLGCPVVVSNVSSLPEIAGEAGVYVEPESVASIGNGLVKCIKERKQASGKKRVEKGLALIKNFSWDKAASEVLTVLEEVGAKK